MSLVDYLAKNECREVAFNRSSWFVDFLARNLQQIDIRNPILVYQEVELNRSREYKKNMKVGEVDLVVIDKENQVYLIQAKYITSPRAARFYNHKSAAISQLERDAKYFKDNFWIDTNLVWAIRSREGGVVYSYHKKVA